MADDKEQGMYKKYHVLRLNDGEGKHADCSFFVLDIDHDPIARLAFKHYMTLAEAAGYKALAFDMYNKLLEVEG